MSKVIFTFEGMQTTIQCSRNEKMKDICQKFSNKSGMEINKLFFLYGGDQINNENTFEQQANALDKERNEINLLVFEKSNQNLNQGKVKSKDIICPQCFENCLINF